MTTLRPFLLLSTSVAAAILAGEAMAATPAIDAAASGTETVVITGTRTEGRSKLDTLAPVDVVAPAEIQNRGSTEFAAALAESVPSLNFPRAAEVDATDSVRPATLRGLSPDETLVLVNGLRQHASALVNINGSVGRGAAAVDLNTIPTAALETVEVLRDGASAQYGSDAIAGVVNLRLKQANSGGGATITGGGYRTDYTTARGGHDASDGGTVTASVWQGFSLGGDGFLTLTGEYLHRGSTGRSDFDPRAAANGQVTARMGDPQIDPQWTFVANAGYDLADGWQVYGWAQYQDRNSKSAAFPRLSDNVNNVAAIYPNGFLPKIGVASQDVSAAGGVRGSLLGWKTDVSVSYGRNALDFSTLNSLNATYGSASPTNFDDGSLIYDQIVLDAAFSRGFDIGLAGPLNFAWGLEERFENYQIEAGQHESWDRGPLGSNTGLAGGAQGFVGFQPSNVVDQDRNNFAAYLDLELALTTQFTVDGAVRFEHYSDFGDTVTGKVSARYDFTPNFALRGSFSTGFRAPSLQQSYFTSTSSVIQDGAVVETGTFPATSPVAAALGGKPLKAEKSKNYSAGAVFRLGDFDLTVDAYRIDIDDQIVLSELINRSFSAQVASLLDPLHVQAARFFLNGVASRTRGIDAVGHYKLPADAFGEFDFTLAGNYNDVAVTKVPTNSSVLNPVPTLFARQRILTLTNGAPEYKVTAATDWNLDKFGATLRATYYGDVLQPASTAAGDYWTGNKLIFDLEARYRVNDHLGVAAGADNILDTYPTATPAALNSNGVLGFPYYSPFGFNGRYVYARLNVNW
jgi:iron complex outermembrane receptor protein